MTPTMIFSAQAPEFLRLTILLALIGLSLPTTAGNCTNSVSGQKQVLWGDLHVHTAHSLDAWAFGALATPKDAYAFAKGQPLLIASGEQKVIDRPLDFAAVTDHAETFDQMYLCTDPVYADDEYCIALRESHIKRESRTIFNNALLPVIGANPQLPGVCDNENFDCDKARFSQWQRHQYAANYANEPCEFTALIGYEWTASPNVHHWHRNVIFRSAQVPDEAYDYVRFPRVQSLWQKLNENCLEKDGCQVLTIPHNINWAEGGRTFAIEDESEQEWATRARFERLAEIHQEKGNSECLPERKEDLGEDCNFELMTTTPAQAYSTVTADLTPEEVWTQSRSSYYRSLLSRGLSAYQSGTSRTNPLTLGAIASTDTHFGTPGRVSEADYSRGISTMFLSDEEMLQSTAMNAGGLVAVWAEENTRASIFDALYRRETYATSGPRILLRFGVADKGYCESAGNELHTTMGSQLDTSGIELPWFIVEAMKDQAKLRKVEIIKGELRDGAIHETVTEVEAFPSGANTTCVTWQDENYDADAPAYWYARISEEPTPRWSKYLCESANLCKQYPDADTMVSERAWSSPIWRLP